VAESIYAAEHPPVQRQKGLFRGSHGVPQE
jgi:hypothetical protein